MTIADPVALLRSGSGVGAFNVILLEHAEALVAAAESAGTPVVLQISQNAVKYHGALEPLLQATLAVARASTAPVVVHLDHAERIDLVDEAVRLGVGSVMYDGSRLRYEENVAATAKVAATCHAAGVAVEAELGEVGGKDGAHAPGARTDPAEAAAFVAVSAAPVGPVPDGDSFLNRRVAMPLISRLLRPVYDDLGAMEADLRRSTLEWSVVRPPKFTDKPTTGRYRMSVGGNVPRGYTISRGDVAHAMLAVLADPATVRQPVGIAY